jgi:peptidoglycan/LPS O-acetylase OafA/YrhL
MTPDYTNRSYYPALDGLRGVAILLVLLHHNFDFIPFMQFGWIGVDLFFVLSGFLITEILLQKRNHKNYLRNFYIRRALRILPVYYLCIILFFLLAPYFSKLADQQIYYSKYQFFLWTNLQNWLCIFYPPPNDYMLFNHFWSLSIEEQFYLTWPLLILFFKTMQKLSVLLLIFLIIGIVSRIVSWKISGSSYTNFEFQERTRMDSLYLGSLIALWKYYSPALLKKKLILFCTGLLLIHLVVVIFIKIYWPFIPHFSFLGYTSIAAIFALVVYYGIAGKGKIKQYFLESKWLKWLGKISYGLYVYHFILLILFRIYLTDKLVSVGFSNGTSYILLSVSSLIPAIFISWLSYNMFEKKILSLKSRFL